MLDARCDQLTRMSELPVVISEAIHCCALGDSAAAVADANNSPFEIPKPGVDARSVTTRSVKRTDREGDGFQSLIRLYQLIDY